MKAIGALDNPNLTKPESDKIAVGNLLRLFNSIYFI